MATISIRINDDLKQNAQKLFDDLGMDLTTAITVFLSQAVRERSIPFRIGCDVPNTETAAAMREVEEMAKRNERGFSSVEEMFKELDSDA